MSHHGKESREGREHDLDYYKNMFRSQERKLLEE